MHKAEAAEAEKMAAAVPSLGTVPMDLDVKGEGPTTPHELHAGLRSLLESKECCDIVFIAGEERIEAHAVVLAASSGSFCTFLRQNPALGLSMSAVDSPKEMEDLFSVQQKRQPDQPDTSIEVGQATTEAEGVTETNSTKNSQADVADMPTDPGKTESDAVTIVATEPAETGTGAEPKPAEAQEVSQPAEEPKQAPKQTDPTDKEREVKEVEKEMQQKMHIHVNGLSSAEALHIILDYVYKGFGGADWQYNATTAQVNKDVLRLARSFGFSHLHEHAARWLATGLTTENVLERLVTCEEFGLGLLREKINERLALKPAELMLVCSSPEITKHPRILQDLLVQVASLQDKQDANAQDGNQKEEEAEKENHENQESLENKENKNENRQDKQTKKEKPDKHKPTKAEKMAKQEKPQAEKQPAKRRKA